MPVYLNACDHCGQRLATHRCPACGLALCPAHKACPECSDDEFVPCGCEFTAEEPSGRPESAKSDAA